MIWPYFIPIIVVSAIQFVRISSLKSSKEILFLLAAIFLLLFSGTRGNSSGDYTNYITYGQKIMTFSDVIYCPGFPMEMGYRFFSWLVNIFHLPVQFVILAMNAVSIGCIYKAIKKYSYDIKLSLLLFLPFFFQYDMHAARTASAMGIIVLSISYILERKLIKFLLLVALAAMFHTEAVIFIPMYFLWNVKINTAIGFVILFAELLFVRFIGIGNLLIKLLGFVYLDSLAYKFNHYIFGAYSVYTYATNIIDPRYIIAMLIWVLAKKYIAKPDKYEMLLMNISFGAIFIMIFFGEYTFLFDRLSAFYSIFMIFLIPCILSHIKFEKKSYKLVTVLFFMVYACAYALRLGSSQAYQFFSIIYWN